MKKKFISASQQHIAEALESVLLPENREELQTLADQELALIDTNFIRACEALPKDTNLDCLLNDQTKRCKKLRREFDKAIFESH